MKKVETIAAYVNLISEILFLLIGVVVLKILIVFYSNFGGLMNLAKDL